MLSAWTNQRKTKQKKKKEKLKKDVMHMRSKRTTISAIRVK